MFSRWPLFPNEADHHLCFCDPNGFVLGICSWRKNATESLANTPDLSGKKKKKKQPVLTIKYRESAERLSSCMPTDARGSCPGRTAGRTRPGCWPCCGRPQSLEVQTSHRKGWCFTRRTLILSTHRFPFVPKWSLQQQEWKIRQCDRHVWDVGREDKRGQRHQCLLHENAGAAYEKGARKIPIFRDT